MIKWDNFRTRLDLDHDQTIIIQYLIDRLKDHFAEVCEAETEEHELSPVEYIVEIKINSPELDDSSVEKRLIEYLAKEKKLGTGLSYLKACEQFDLSTQKDIERLLNKDQRAELRSMKIPSMMDVFTGYAPIVDKVTEQLNTMEEKRNIDIFCSIPFEFAYIDDNGDVYPCCPSKFVLSIGNLGTDSLLDIWNSKAATAVRKSILDKTFRYCDYQACEYLKMGKLKRESKSKNDIQDLNAACATTASSAPKIINFAYDRTCNIACSYCRNEIHRHGNNMPEMIAEIHKNIFEKDLRGVQRLIVSGNGDPFASSFYMDMLKNFDRDKYPDTRIKIQTNGLLLTPETWDSIACSHGAIDWISVSVDAAEEETYKKNRGGSFSKLLRNLEFVGGLRKSRKIEHFFMNFVVQANNFREMKRFVQLGLKYGCDLVEFQCIENWGTYLPDEFEKVAVHHKSHPEHEEFLEVLNDLIFEDRHVSVTKLLEFMPMSVREKLLKKSDVVKYDTFGST